MIQQINRAQANVALTQHSNSGQHTRIVTYINLTAAELVQVNSLLSAIFGSVDKILLRTFLDIAAVWGQELPRRLRESVYRFKLNEAFEAVCVRGLRLNELALGPTPQTHRRAGQREMVSRPEVFHILCASLLGEVFAWSTIQNGYIMNDIMPVKQHIDLISSSGSASKFDFHTEDAFHPCAGDYLGLMCFRNPDRVPTILSAIHRGDLDNEVMEILFEPRFIIGANVAQEVAEVKHFSPILFGNKDRPYMRVNLNNTSTLSGDKDAKRALECLKQILQNNASAFVLEPGDCWYIDNLRVVHGRWPFKARFDGSDRWLKRLYVSSSYRYSSAFKPTPSSRVLYPLGVNQ